MRIVLFITFLQVFATKMLNQSPKRKRKHVPGSLLLFLSLLFFSFPVCFFFYFFIFSFYIKFFCGFLIKLGVTMYKYMH